MCIDDVLCGEGGVVHEEKVDVVDCHVLVGPNSAMQGAGRTVGNEERLVAAGHQVAGLPVGAVSDL